MARNYLATPSDAPWKRTLGLYTGWEIIDANGHVIATVIDNTCAKPNARLISHAPDLLAALNRLIQSLPEDSNEYPDSASARQVFDSIRFAREAISKATGGAL